MQRFFIRSSLISRSAVLAVGALLALGPLEVHAQAVSDATFSNLASLSPAPRDQLLQKDYTRPTAARIAEPQSPVTTHQQLTATESKTDGATLGDIAQIGASVASLLTLFFLLWQNIMLRRQTQSLEQSVRSQTYQEIVSNYCEINKSLVEDEKLAAAFDTLSFAEIETPEAERRKRWLTFWLLNHYENAFMQQNLGSLPAASWAGIEADCLAQLKRPYVAKVWEASKDLYSAEFRQFIESRLM